MQEDPPTGHMNMQAIAPRAVRADSPSAHGAARASPVPGKTLETLSPKGVEGVSVPIYAQIRVPPPALPTSQGARWEIAVKRPHTALAVAIVPVVEMWLPEIVEQAHPAVAHKIGVPAPRQAYLLSRWFLASFVEIPCSKQLLDRLALFSKLLRQPAQRWPEAWLHTGWSQISVGVPRALVRPALELVRCE